MGGPGLGVEGPRLMQSAWSFGVGRKVQFCHPQSQVVQQGPLRCYLPFPGPRTLKSSSSFLGPRTPSNTVLASATHQHKSATGIHMSENEVY